MVGFLPSPAADGPIKEENEDIKPVVSADTKKLEDLWYPELEDVPSSFSDLFLDLESIDGWFLEGIPQPCGDPGMASLRGDPIGIGLCFGDLGNAEDCFKAAGNDILERAEGKEKSVESREDFFGGDGSGGKLGALGCLIEEQLGKVSLGESSFINGGEMAKLEKIVKGEEAVSDEDESRSDGGVKSEGGVPYSSSSSSASASASDSSSGSSDNEDGGEKDQDLEIEEGEIVLPDDVDEMVAWSDNEDVMAGGPIMSKNELKDCPPVPAVNVTLQPHHETLPVGVILSIIGAQVIVDGVEKHNPLNEGSILWVTETRLPLGIVDEIFGPVKNPYYIVRYNSESEVPMGIELGTLVSFVQEFANHVLNDKSLYQKGYDASGENDEELADELEFSDDEKEAEYRRMLKMKKRGIDGPKPVNRKKEKQKPKRQNGNWNHDRGEPPLQTPLSDDMIPATQEQQSVGPLPIAAPLNQENMSFPLGPNSDLAGIQAMASQFQSQGPGFGRPNGIWNNNGFPHQQQQYNQSMLGPQPNGLPGNGGMLWMQQNRPFQLFQMPPQTNMAFQQQMGPVPGLPFNFNGLGGQTNFVRGPMLATPPWPSVSMGQNMLNPSQFGMGLQTQRPSGTMNGGEQGGRPRPQGPQNGQNPQQMMESLNFGQGRGGGGRRGHYRGGRGRFDGGRGKFERHRND